MNTNPSTISGRIIDILAKEIYSGTLHLSNGKISRIVREEVTETHYLLPGFVDAHVHVESSMLVPSEFARLAVVHGTVATVSDPHEIGNVLGLKGVEWMIENGKTVPFKFYFGAPSCVPATVFETAGATITAADIEKLFQNPDVKYLAEMMNWPGTLARDPEVMEKIALAVKYGKQVDGHAPGLRGEQARQYASAGITTDHECFTAEEALDKLNCGMHILIREGSAAKNFEALIGLLNEYPERIMFCSDDKHPDNLVEGHINLLVKRALAQGIDLFKVLRAACINPVAHYMLEVGQLREGDPADFIVTDSLEELNVLRTFVNGLLVAENGKTLISSQPVTPVNHFLSNRVTATDLLVNAISGVTTPVMEALEGQLITNRLEMSLPDKDGILITDKNQDVLKLVVVNRYRKASPAIAFIKGFGLSEGALASSVAHDSHNVIAVGVDDESLASAINLIMDSEGGVAAVSGSNESVLALPVAGLMSAEDGYKVADAYSALDRISKEMGSSLASPFMTLSFMGLLVIPALKLSDLGLFDGEKFAFVKGWETSAIENS
jgi:adenine deaminase